MTTPILYGHRQSSSTNRIRIALAHKGIAYELRVIDVREGEHLTEEYRREVNASGEVPTLAIDSVHLSQSVAILEYLEETRPQVPLLPPDPAARAKVRRMVEIINSAVQPLQNLRVVRKVRKDYGDTSLAWPQHWIEWGFEGLEALLTHSAGRYCQGDTVTLADVFLVPQVAGATNRYRLGLERFEHIRRIYANLMELPAFQLD